jgi:hypothetical protein
VSERFSGIVAIVDSDNQEVFRFDSGFALLDLGAGRRDGDLRLHGKAGETKIRLDGGRCLISIADDDGNETLRLDGNSGDIILQNAECAEEFDYVGDEVEPGDIVVLDDSVAVSRSRRPFDRRRVVGIVSGAGDFRPAMVLDRRHDGDRRAPVAIAGKAFCKVDAAYAPVGVGDLLTTSATPGHAMLADDPLRAFGAVIGKALAPLTNGTALVPVLVGLL